MCDDAEYINLHLPKCNTMIKCRPFMYIHTLPTKLHTISKT